MGLKWGLTTEPRRTTDSLASAFGLQVRGSQACITFTSESMNSLAYLAFPQNCVLRTTVLGLDRQQFQGSKEKSLKRPARDPWGRRLGTSVNNASVKWLTFLVAGIQPRAGKQPQTEARMSYFKRLLCGSSSSVLCKC